MTDDHSDPGLRWSPFKQWAARRDPPEPEPEQPETDGPIPFVDPDQGQGNRYHPQPKIDMNILLREAAGIDTHRRPGRRVPPY